MKVVSLSVLRTGRLYPQEIAVVLVAAAEKVRVVPLWPLMTRKSL